jgi:two-component system nitrogen regulation response regulator GlnG
VALGQPGEGDLVITDVVMPDENAFDLLPRIKKLRPDLPVIVMSAQNTFMTAIRPPSAAPTNTAEALRPEGTDRDRRPRAGEPKRSRRPKPEGPTSRNETMPLVGRSPAMQEIYRVLARLMQTDLTVMITGESAPARNWWRARCTTTASAATARSSPSTWRRSRAT